MLEAAAERIAQKIDGKRIGHIIEPDGSEQPPTPDTQCKLQAPDRKQRDQVDEDDGDSEEDEDRPARGSAYGTEPGDKPEMDKQGGCECEAEFSRAAPQWLERIAEQRCQCATSVGQPEQQEVQPPRYEQPPLTPLWSAPRTAITTAARQSAAPTAALVHIQVAGRDFIGRHSPD